MIYGIWDKLHQTYVYVGRTTLPLRTRWTCHKSRARTSQSLIAQHLRTYGIANHEIRFLEESSDPTREAEWIADLGTYPTWCNSEPTGTGGKVPGVTRTFSDEAKANIGRAQRGTRKAAKPCIVKGREFGSATEAAHYFGTYLTTVSRWIREGKGQYL